MRLKLHHINLVHTSVPELDAFYRDILDLKDEPGMSEKRKLDEGYPGAVSFMTCLLYTSPSPRDATLSRMPSSA